MIKCIDSIDFRSISNRISCDFDLILIDMINQNQYAVEPIRYRVNAISSASTADFLCPSLSIIIG